MQIFDNLNIVHNWLINQSSKYGITINFFGGNFGLQNDIKLDQIQYWSGPGGIADMNIVSTILKKVGYKNSLEFYEWVKNHSNCDNTFVLIFIKGNGRNYAIQYTSENMNRESYYVEGAILHKYYPDGMLVPVASIAHEILHLFGAWDLYETQNQTKDREERAKVIFPNSIMHRNSYDINDLSVDEITAWLIGWNNTPKDWYEWFKPND